MREKFLRPCRKVTDQFIIAAVLSVAVTALAFVPVEGVLGKLIPDSFFSGLLNGDADGGQFMRQYFDFVWIWLTAVLAVLLFRSNWPMFRALWYNRKGNNILGLILGLFFGFACNGFCVLMSVIKGDIHLSYSGFEAVPFFAFLACVFIQSGAEELVDRWYLYQKLRRRYRSPVIAIVINSLVFMALHIPNPGVTRLALVQIFTVGFLFSLFVYYYNGLWIAMAFHAGWNFTQSIVFGLPNSGIVSEYSVFKLEAASGRNGFFYNVNFGVEGSIGAVIVLALFCVILILINRKKHECCDVWEKAEQKAYEKIAASRGAGSAVRVTGAGSDSASTYSVNNTAETPSATSAAETPSAASAAEAGAGSDPIAEYSESNPVETDPGIDSAEAAQSEDISPDPSSERKEAGSRRSSKYTPKH